jgi:hypothetical protein
MIKDDIFQLMNQFKLRVPGDNRKHIVCEIEADHKTLYADYTDYRDDIKPDPIPVYIANDVSDMVLYGYKTREDLSKLGVY